MPQPQLHTLVFDWGNTLMKEFPGSSGPMAEWEFVEAVEGAHSALEALSRQYRLVVATNAAQSSPQQVRAALARVGLDTFIADIFTASRLDGFRKPQLEFFHGIQTHLGLDAGQLLMVGDDFSADIRGARSAAWRAVWFNPGCLRAAALRPIHHAEVMRLEQLPAAFSRLGLPDIDQCSDWLVQQHGSHALWMHVQSVAAAAYCLALWLRQRGEEVDPVLAHRAGLLHDLAKISARLQVPPASHGEMGERLLLALGQPELAAAARRHMLYCIYDEQEAPRSWEEKLVYFSDKLVEGSHLVSLEARISSLRGRYTHDAERIQRTLPLLETLQEDICAACGFPPAELLPHLQKAFFESA